MEPVWSKRAWLSAMMGCLLLSGGCPHMQDEGDGNSNGDGDGGGDEPELVENTPPIASAGADVTAVSGELVVLDGAGSFDADGDRLVFIWRQVTSGPEIVLVNAFASRPQFIAPEVDEQIEIVFRLTVADGFTTATDEVLITLQPAP